MKYHLSQLKNIINIKLEGERSSTQESLLDSETTDNFINFIHKNKNTQSKPNHHRCLSQGNIGTNVMQNIDNLIAKSSIPTFIMLNIAKFLNNNEARDILLLQKE